MAEKPLAGVSVIMCCYNSAEYLPETLRCLAMQQVSAAVPWEILVIDNASTDDTALVAVNEWSKYNLKNVGFTVYTELSPGRGFAYKLGMQKARYEYLIACDDDNRLCSDYVNTAFEIMDADPLIGALGGCGIFDPEQPAWSGINDYKESYVNGSQTWAANAHWVYGAGSTSRKSMLAGLYEKGWQPITAGRNGSKLISGEDVEICFGLFLSGYKIMADDRLKFNHFVPLKRQSLEYLLNLKYWISYSYVLLNNYLMLIEKDKNTVNSKLNRWLFYALKEFLKLWIKLAHQKLIKRIPVSDEQKLIMKGNLGILSSILENRLKILKHHESLKHVFHPGQSLQT